MDHALQNIPKQVAMLQGSRGAFCLVVNHRAYNEVMIVAVLSVIDVVQIHVGGDRKRSCP